VVKDLIESVQAKALDQKVLDSLTPGQQVIKILRDELTAILAAKQAVAFFGPAAHHPDAGRPPGLREDDLLRKLAKWCLGLQKNPLLMSFDLKRPAAQDQLQMIAGQLGLPFYGLAPDQTASPRKPSKTSSSTPGTGGMTRSSLTLPEGCISTRN